jgi:hypothetical protein
MKEIIKLSLPKDVREGDEICMMQDEEGKIFAMFLPIGKVKEDKDVNVVEIRKMMIEESLKTIVKV